MTVSGDASGAADWSGYQSGVVGGAAANVTVYPRKPLVDNESPRSLQSFLQRTTYVAFDAGAQVQQFGSWPSPGATYVQDYANASASICWFVLPYLAILGGAGSSYELDKRPLSTDPLATYSQWDPSLSLGLDLRSGDASLTLEALGVAGVSKGSLIKLGGRIVIDRSYALAASASIIQDGSALTASLGWYPTKDLGLSIAGVFDNVGDLFGYNRILGVATLSWWVVPRLELWVAVSPGFLSSVSWADGMGVWQQEFTLGFTGRVSGR